MTTSTNTSMISSAFSFPITKTSKAAFNSMFLVQYDAHFSAISHIYTQAALFKLLQTTMPDVAVNKTEAALLSIATSRRLYEAQCHLELGDVVFGLPDTLSPKTASVLRLIHRFRYAQYRKSSKHLHILMDQKFAGSGLVWGGRYTKNFRRNVRFGCAVRANVWAFYNSALYRSVELDRKGLYPSNAIIPTWFRKNTAPSAFFRRRFKSIVFQGIHSRRLLLVVLLSAVAALRSVWFQTSKQMHIRQLNTARWSEASTKNYRNHEMLRFGFRAGNGRFKIVPFASGNRPGTTDLNTRKQIVRWKANLKHHARRLGFTWYEKKLWGYTKNRRYWRYMQWIAHFYFRGLAYHRLFYMRLDVFLVYHLRVRNIRHARILITGGHAFIGDTVCKKTTQFVLPMTAVVISKYARNWLNYYHQKFKSWRGAKRLGMGLLVFGRYFENAYIYGPGYIFAIPYGDPLDLLWAKRAGKSGFFAFSYYQGQKTVTSAWW